MTTKMQETKLHCMVVARIMSLVRIVQFPCKKQSGVIHTHEAGREWRKILSKDWRPNVIG